MELHLNILNKILYLNLINKKINMVKNKIILKMILKKDYILFFKNLIIDKIDEYV